MRVTKHQLFFSIVAFFICFCFASLASSQVSDTGNLNIKRKGHTATDLPNGSVLIIGGDNETGPLAASEIYNPDTKAFQLSVNLITARTHHHAALLPDGRVIVFGGQNHVGILSSTEILDPSTGLSVAGPSMNRARVGHSATFLASGHILIVGGDSQGSAEIFDPQNMSFSFVQTNLKTPRSNHSAALLENGLVLIVGGLDAAGTPTSSAELFDPNTGTFIHTETPMRSARVLPTLRVLPDGKVKVVGGDTEGTMEMYSPEENYFAARARVHHDPAVRLTQRDEYALSEISETNELLVTGGVDNADQVLQSSLLITGASASVTTDKVSYSPGETVTITGTGWLPGENVSMVIDEEPSSHPPTVLSSVADAQGNFTNTDFVIQPDDVGVTFTLTATGETSGYVAETTFTDETFDLYSFLRTSANIRSFFAKNQEILFRLGGAATTGFCYRVDWVRPNNTTSAQSFLPGISSTRDGSHTIPVTEQSGTWIARVFKASSSTSGGTCTGATFPAGAIVTRTFDVARVIIVGATETNTPANGGVGGDNYVDQGGPNDVKDSGTGPDLFIKSKPGSAEKWIFLRFQLTGTVNPTNAASTMGINCYAPPCTISGPVTHGRVRMFMENHPGSDRPYGIHRLNATWHESTITWNNKPASQATPTSTTQTGPTQNLVLRHWTVTSDVHDFINNAITNYGWRISDESNLSSSLESKFRSTENNSTDSNGPINNRPILLVDYDPPVCGNGTQESGEACDDGNTANGDCCNSSCQYEASGSACTDGFFCNGTDTCNGAGVCTHSGDPCAGPDGDANCAESCNEDGDNCTAADPNGSVCTDGSACTQNDNCQAGVCVGTATGCDDANACTSDACDSVTGCTNTPITCNDGSACTADSCDPATGCIATPVTCNDGNACTADSCNPATGCNYASITCDDGNACTADSCDPASGCTTTPVNCDDGNACTADSCDPASGCTTTPVNCDDGNACTSDSCDPVTGCTTIPVSCDDGNACTTDSCDPATGCTTAPVSCDDGNACTADSCDPSTGCVSTPISCDDGNACTSDSCDPASGCSTEPVVCDDGSACTTDSCDPATGCTTAPVVCHDGNECTTDTCDPQTGCGTTAVACDDGNACTTDSCDSVNGCTTAPITCDDGNACTADSCDPATGCTASPVSCNDGNACTTESCDPVSGCVVNPVACADDNKSCTVESCDPVTGCSSTPDNNTCNDNNVCTDDSCSPGDGSSNATSGCVSTFDPTNDPSCVACSTVVTVEANFTQKGSSTAKKVPVQGARVLMLAKSEVQAVCQNLLDANCVWSNFPAGTPTEPVVTTDSNGQANVISGRSDPNGWAIYVDLQGATADSKPINAGTFKIAVSNSECAPEKRFQVILVSDGATTTAMSQRQQRYQGSILDVIYPESVQWDGYNFLYPFIFISDSNWEVNVCGSVPEGYRIVGSPCVQLFVANQTKVIFFDITEVGSPEPTLSLRGNVKRGNKVQKLNIHVPGVRKLKRN